MNELDAPPPPNADDLDSLLATATAALTGATADRHRLEREIRQATDIEALAGLHAAWQEAVELQAAADERQRDLLVLLASMN